jgi:hypothetical protein
MGWKRNGGGGSFSGYTQVANFAALPLASIHTGEIYVVLATTGIPFLTRKKAGFYISDGAIWNPVEDISAIETLRTDNLTISNLSGILKATTGAVSVATGGSDYESPLTFSSGLTRTVNDVKNDLITGKAGGQTIIGGTGASDDLLLQSTSNGTKGSVAFGSLTTGAIWDEVNNRLGIGTPTPSSKVTIVSEGLGTNVFTLLNLSDSTPMLNLSQGSGGNSNFIFFNYAGDYGAILGSAIPSVLRTGLAVGWVPPLSGTQYAKTLSAVGSGIENITPSTYGSECLTNGALTGGTSWTATTDVTLTSDKAVFAYATTGVGLIDQFSADFAVALKSSTWYVCTLTISNAVPNAQTYPDILVYTNISAGLVADIKATNGAKTVYFKTNATPDRFRLRTAMLVGQSFDMDAISVKEITSGGLYTGGGTTGLQITPAGNISVGGIEAPTSVNMLLHAPAGANPTFRMSDADVTQPFTAVGFVPEVTSNTTAQIGASSGTLGGVQINGFSGGDQIPLAFIGYVGTATPTKAPVVFRGYKSNGTTGRADIGATEQLFRFDNGDTANLMTMLGSGNTGFGTATPTSKLVVSNNTSIPTPVTNTTVDIVGADATNNRLVMTSAGTGVASFFQARHSRGTIASPTATQSGDNLFSFFAGGYGTSYTAARASLDFFASENWTATANGTYLSLYTTLNGAATRSERLRIDNSGNVGIGVTSPTALTHIGASTTARASLCLAAGTAPTAPVSGDMWNDSTQACIRSQSAGITKSLSGVIFTQTASATVGNTTTETAVIGTGVGVTLLPANFWVAGKTIRLKMYGHISCTAADTASVRIKVGSVTVASSIGDAFPVTLTDSLFIAELIMTCRTTGATGTLFVQGNTTIYAASSADMTVYGRQIVTTSVVTIDTTATGQLNATYQWSDARAGNTITSTNSVIEVLN